MVKLRLPSIFRRGGASGSRGGQDQMSSSPCIVSPFLLVYFLTATLAWLVPLIVMGAARGRLARANAYANANADGNENGNNNNNNNQDNQQAYYNTCHWWQWGCNSGYYGNGDDNVDQNNNNNNQDNANANQEQSVVPWWWFFASDDEKRLREESQSNNPAMVLVYIWSLLLFAALVWFGHRQLQRNGDLYRAAVGFGVFANLALLSLLLLGGLEGGVQTEGPELEEQGFYAQFGVMMVLTNAFYFLFAFAYGIVFVLRARRKPPIQIDIDESDYKIHDEHIETV